MTQLSLQELRRAAESLAALRGVCVSDATLRSDHGQLRIELADGQLLVVGAALDSSGRPRLEIDVVRRRAEPGGQLEVRFERSEGLDE